MLSAPFAPHCAPLLLAGTTGSRGTSNGNTDQYLVNLFRRRDSSNPLMDAQISLGGLQGTLDSAQQALPHYPQFGSPYSLPPLSGGGRDPAASGPPRRQAPPRRGLRPEQVLCTAPITPAPCMFLVAVRACMLMKGMDLRAMP